MRWMRRITGLGFLLVAACGPGAGASARTPPHSETVITAEELRDATAGNLFDYIRAQRPRWLERNYSAVLRADRVSMVAVFLDNQEFGGPEALRQLPLTSAAEVRYFSPSEAQARFGPGYLNGVIQVLSRAAN